MTDCKKSHILRIVVCHKEMYRSTVVYATTNVNELYILVRYSILFVLAYTEIYVFMSNPFQPHSLQQSYHPTQPFKEEKYRV